MFEFKYASNSNDNSIQFIYPEKLEISYTIAGASTHAQVARTLDLTSIKSREWQIQPCSGKTGEGVQDGMEWVMKHIKSK